MAKRPVEKYDFKAFGEAIKAARTERKESRKKVSDEMFISPRYLANIENKTYMRIMSFWTGSPTTITTGWAAARSSVLFCKCTMILIMERGCWKTLKTERN